MTSKARGGVDELGCLRKITQGRQDEVESAGRNQAPNLTAERAFALAASASRFLGDEFV